MPGFFDKVKSGISEKAVEATIRSKEAIDTQQVKGKISDLENQKKKIFLEIGQAVYTMFQSSAFDQDALAQPCQAVGSLDVQIREKEQELEEIHRKAEAALAEQRPGGSSASH